jgi:DNA-binding transcriptional LysR family regulator
MAAGFDLSDLRAFGLVAAAGGVSAAARQSGISKAALSRALARLEAAAGTALFDRLPRGLRPTARGETLLPAAREAVRLAREAEEVIRSGSGEPAGVLRLAASALTSQQILAPVLAELARRHPSVEVVLEVTSRAPDPLVEDLDVVLRIGRPPEPALVARRIVSGTLKLYAANALAEAIDITDPAIVSTLPRIVIDAPGVPTEWTLSDGHGRVVLAAAPAMRVADPSIAIGVMTAGVGLSFLPDVYGDSVVPTGQLARVLPGWVGPVIEVYASLPPGRTSVPAVRVFLDLVVAHVASINAAHGAGGLVR